MAIAAARKPEPMDDDKLKAVVKNEIHNAVGYLEDEIDEDRREALEYYYGRPLGNEVEGRSAVVSTDVQDTVESIMPDFVEIFTGSDETFEFEPVGQEDEPFAEQATDYIRHVFFKDNDGFGLTHDVIKDALLQKNGILKVYWDDTPIMRRETLTGVNSLQLQSFMDDEDIEIVEYEEAEVEEEESPFVPDGVLHNVTIRRTTERGRAKIVCVPPEEFLISRWATGLNMHEAECRLVGHRVKRTQSQLLAMGFDPEIIYSLPDWDEEGLDDERNERFGDESFFDGNTSLDASTREIWVYECYLLVDYDGDGYSEIRAVTVAGTQYAVLENEEVDDHPFVSLTPIRMPHKFFGRSIAELVMDIQKIKSTIWRQILDNMYLINNARSGISNRVDEEDWLSGRPGGTVRVDTDSPDVQGHFAPLVTPSIGNHVFPLMEYTDSVRETRTGVTRYNQGLDADSLNKTATGINQILGQAQKRKLLIARIFADGFKDTFKKLLRLVINHQDRARVIRLRGQWVPMDPRSWNADMDIVVNVGLGHGTKESQAMADRMMLQAMQQIVQMQGGIEGPLVTGKNLHYVLKRSAANMGYYDPDRVFSDPQSPEIQQMMAQRAQRPDPRMQALMADLELRKAEMSADQQRKAAELQAKIQREQAEMQAQRERNSAELAQKQAEIDSKYGLEAEKMRTEMTLRERQMREELAMKREQIEAEIRLKARELGMETAMDRYEADLQAETARETAKAKGSNNED